MAQAMQGVTKALSRLNRSVSLPGLQKIMADFERENTMMEMKQEVMDDTIDEVMGADGEEDAEEEIVAQVLDELGLAVDGQLVSAPQDKTALAPPKAAATPDADLMVRSACAAKLYHCCHSHMSRPPGSAREPAPRVTKTRV